jgi:hypothetical protein
VHQPTANKLRLLATRLAVLGVVSLSEMIPKRVVAIVLLGAKTPSVDAALALSLGCQFKTLFRQECLALRKSAQPPGPELPEVLCPSKDILAGRDISTGSKRSCRPSGPVASPSLGPPGPPLAECPPTPAGLSEEARNYAYPDAGEPPVSSRLAAADLEQLLGLLPARGTHASMSIPRALVTKVEARNDCRLHGLNVAVPRLCRPPHTTVACLVRLSSLGVAEIPRDIRWQPAFLPISSSTAHFRNPSAQAHAQRHATAPGQAVPAAVAAEAADRVLGPPRPAAAGRRAAADPHAAAAAGPGGDAGCRAHDPGGAPILKEFVLRLAQPYDLGAPFAARRRTAHAQDISQEACRQEPTYLGGRRKCGPASEAPTLTADADLEIARTLQGIDNRRRTKGNVNQVQPKARSGKAASVAKRPAAAAKGDEPGHPAFRPLSAAWGCGFGGSVASGECPPGRGRRARAASLGTLVLRMALCVCRAACVGPAAPLKGAA